MKTLPQWIRLGCCAVAAVGFGITTSVPARGDKTRGLVKWRYSSVFLSSQPLT